MENDNYVQLCRGSVKKEYKDQVILIKFELNIQGVQKLNSVLKSIACFSHKFYLDCISYIRF